MLQLNENILVKVDATFVKRGADIHRSGMMVRYAIKGFPDFCGNTGFRMRHRPANGILVLNAK